MDQLSDRVEARLIYQEAEHKAHQEEIERADREYDSLYSTIKAVLLDVTAEATGIRVSDLVELATLEHFAARYGDQEMLRWNTPQVEVPTAVGPLNLPQEAKMLFSVDGVCFSAQYRVTSKEFPYYSLKGPRPFYRYGAYSGRDGSHFSAFEDAYIHCKGIAEQEARYYAETEQEEDAIAEAASRDKSRRKAELEALVAEIAQSPLLLAALQFIVKVERERFRADEYSEYLDESLARAEQAAIEKQADADDEIYRLRRELDDAKR